MSKKPLPPIQRKNGNVTTIDDGIYHEVIEEYSADGVRTAIQQALRPREPATARVKKLRDQMAASIRRAILAAGKLPEIANWPKGAFGVRLDIGDGPQAYLLIGHPGIRQMCEALESLNEALGTNPTESECRVFLAVFTCGRLWECARILPQQRFALIGKRKAERNRAANQQRSADAEKRRQQRIKLVTAEIERQRQARERLNYAEAVRRAAIAEGCSEDTIRDSVPNIWTGKKRENQGINGTKQ